MEKVRPWCGQPSDRGRLKNWTELLFLLRHLRSLLFLSWVIAAYFFCVFSSRFHDKALHESAVTLHCFGPFFFFSSFFVFFTFSVFCIFPVLFLFYFVFCSSSCSLLSLSGPAITRQWGRAILLTKLVHFISCSLFILFFFFVVLATEWSLAECK